MSSSSSSAAVGKASPVKPSKLQIPAAFTSSSQSSLRSPSGSSQPLSSMNQKSIPGGEEHVEKVVPAWAAARASLRPTGGAGAKVQASNSSAAASLSKSPTSPSAMSCGISSSSPPVSSEGLSKSVPSSSSSFLKTTATSLTPPVSAMFSRSNSSNAKKEESSGSFLSPSKLPIPASPTGSFKPQSQATLAPFSATSKPPESPSALGISFEPPMRHPPSPSSNKTSPNGSRPPLLAIEANFNLDSNKPPLSAVEVKGKKTSPDATKEEKKVEQVELKKAEEEKGNKVFTFDSATVLKPRGISSSPRVLAILSPKNNTNGSSERPPLSPRSLAALPEIPNAIGSSSNTPSPSVQSTPSPSLKSSNNNTPSPSLKALTPSPSMKPLTTSSPSIKPLSASSTPSPSFKPISTTTKSSGFAALATSTSPRGNHSGAGGFSALGGATSPKNRASPTFTFVSRKNNTSPHLQVESKTFNTSPTSSHSDTSQNGGVQPRESLSTGSAASLPSPRSSLMVAPQVRDSASVGEESCSPIGSSSLILSSLIKKDLKVETTETTLQKKQPAIISPKESVTSPKASEKVQEPTATSHRNELDPKSLVIKGPSPPPLPPNKPTLPTTRPRSSVVIATPITPATSSSSPKTTSTPEEVAESMAALPLPSPKNSKPPSPLLLQQLNGDSAGTSSSRSITSSEPAVVMPPSTPVRTLVPPGAVPVMLSAFRDETSKRSFMSGDSSGRSLLGSATKDSSSRSLLGVDSSSRSLLGRDESSRSILAVATKDSSSRSLLGSSVMSKDVESTTSTQSVALPTNVTPAEMDPSSEQQPNKRPLSTTAKKADVEPVGKKKPVEMHSNDRPRNVSYDDDYDEYEGELVDEEEEETNQQVPLLEKKSSGRSTPPPAIPSGRSTPPPSVPPVEVGPESNEIQVDSECGSSSWGSSEEEEDDDEGDSFNPDGSLGSSLSPSTKHRSTQVRQKGSEMADMLSPRMRGISFPVSDNVVDFGLATTTTTVDDAKVSSSSPSPMQEGESTSESMTSSKGAPPPLPRRPSKATPTPLPPRPTAKPKLSLDPNAEPLSPLSPEHRAFLVDRLGYSPDSLIQLGPPHPAPPEENISPRRAANKWKTYLKSFKNSKTSTALTASSSSLTSSDAGAHQHHNRRTTAIVGLLLDAVKLRLYKFHLLHPKSSAAAATSIKWNKLLTRSTSGSSSTSSSSLMLLRGAKGSSSVLFGLRRVTGLSSKSSASTSTSSSSQKRRATSGRLGNGNSDDDDDEEDGERVKPKSTRRNKRRLEESKAIVTKTAMGRGFLPPVYPSQPQLFRRNNPRPKRKVDSKANESDDENDEEEKTSEQDDEELKRRLEKQNEIVRPLDYGGGVINSQIRWSQVSHQQDWL